MALIGCPDCGSTDTARRRRDTIFNQIRSVFNSWPYRCLRCGTCFQAGHRYPSYDRSEHPRPQQERGSEAGRPKEEETTTGPRVAYHREAVRPQAKIVLEADSHEQMDAILMALSRAVSMHKGSAREHARQSRRAHV